MSRLAPWKKTFRATAEIEGRRILDLRGERAVCLVWALAPGPR